MSDDLLDRLRNQSRRSFLKGSALFAASVLASATLRAQEPQAAPKSDDPSTGKAPNADNKDADKKDDKDQTPQQAREGDGAKTYIGADGRAYRICPQCGANMYKQARTWTCENCGYSYDE